MEKTNNSPREAFSDQELDMLIEASFQREALLSSIGTSVMSTVRREARRVLLRHWLRLVVFAFGIPTVLGCFGFGVYYVSVHVELQPALVIGLLLSVITMLVFTIQVVRDFSIREL